MTPDHVGALYRPTPEFIAGAKIPFNCHKPTGVVTQTVVTQGRRRSSCIKAKAVTLNHGNNPPNPLAQTAKSARDLGWQVGAWSVKPYTFNS